MSTDPALDALFGASTPAPSAQGAPASGSDYSGLISAAEQKYGLPAGLLNAVITKGEASGPNAVSPKGAVGIGQLMPGTAKDMGVTDPTDPAQNIDGSGKYLGQLYAKYNDPTLAVAAYNAGPGAVDAHGGVPPYPETQAYVKRVLGPQGAAPAPQSSDPAMDALFGGAPPAQVSPPATSSSPVAPSSAPPAASPSVAQPGAAAPQASNEIVDPTGANNYTPAQVKTIQQLLAAKQFDTAQGAYLTHGGEATTPYMQPADGSIPQAPGVYYIDLAGKLQQTPGKPVSAGEGAAMGLAHGVATVAKSLGSLDPSAYITLPGETESENQRNNEQWQALQQKYGARYANNGYAAAGDIAGQVAGSAPLMAVGGGALDAAAAGGGDIAGFLAGQSAKNGGNLLLRGASLATRGALEGAGAAAQTSAGSNDPLQNQLLQGAMLGGALHLGAPMAAAAGAGIADTFNGLTKPLTKTGRNALINDYLSDLTKGGSSAIQSQSDIPGVTRTLAQSIPGGNAGIGALERSTASSDPEFNNQLVGIRNQNAAARKDYIDTFVSSPQDLQKAQNAQQSVFTKGVMSAMGSADDAPTQQAMSANKARLGGIFDDVASRTDIQNGDQVRTSLGDIVHQAQQVLSDSEVQPLLKQVQNISDTIGKDGTISGESYQALTRKGAPLDRAMASGGNVGFYATQIRGALDDALEASADPKDLQALQQARSQYRNMKLVEAALPADTSQSLDPAKLLSQVSKNTSGYAYTGGGDLGQAALSAIQGAKTGPVAEQQYLRGLNLTTNGEVPTLDKVNGALKKIANDPNAPVTPQTIAKLTTLRDDLAMENGSNAGIGKGSNTFQNLATNALTGAVGKAKNVSNVLAALGGAGELAASHNPLTAGITGLAVKGAADMVGNTYAQKNLLIQQQLRNALLNPDSVTLNTKVPSGSFSGKHPVVNALLKSNAVPIAVDTRNRLLGAT